jgi:G:T-mismatch repair DNA endonuclease (very short patch repair protein)
MCSSVINVPPHNLGSLGSLKNILVQFWKSIFEIIHFYEKRSGVLKIAALRRSVPICAELRRFALVCGGPFWKFSNIKNFDFVSGEQRTVFSKGRAPHPAEIYWKKCTRKVRKDERGTRELFRNSFCLLIIFSCNSMTKKGAREFLDRGSFRRAICVSVLKISRVPELKQILNVHFEEITKSEWTFSIKID